MIEENYALTNKALIEYLLKGAEIKSLFFDNGLVTKSKRNTPYFFNAGMYNTGSTLFVTGKALSELMVQNYGLNIKGTSNQINGIDLLVGPSYKGIMLAAATSMALWHENRVNMPFTFDRKEETKESANKFISIPSFNGKDMFLFGDEILDEVQEDMEEILTSKNEVVFVSPVYESAPLAIAGAIKLSMSSIDKDFGFAYNRLEKKVHGEGSVIGSDWVGRNLNSNQTIVFVYADNIMKSGDAFDFERTVLEQAKNNNKHYKISLPIVDSKNSNYDAVIGKNAFIPEDVFTSGDTKIQIAQDLMYAGINSVKGIGVLIDRQEVDNEGKNAVEEFSKKHNMPVYSSLKIIPAMIYLYENKIPVSLYGEKRPLANNDMIKFFEYVANYGTDEAKKMKEIYTNQFMQD